MSATRYRPRRRLRSEIFPLVSILALPIALYFAFPANTIGFEPAVPAKVERTYSAIVQLGSAREAQLLSAARAAWQSDSSSRRGARADLLGLGQSEGVRVASGLKPEVRPAALPVVEFADNHVPSGLAAQPPATLAPEPTTPPAPAFSKAELLKLKL